MLHKMVLSLAIAAALVGGPALAAEREDGVPPTESAPPPAQPQKDCHAEEAIS